MCRGMSCEERLWIEYTPYMCIYVVNIDANTAHRHHSMCEYAAYVSICTYTAYYICIRRVCDSNKSVNRAVDTAHIR